MENKKPKTYRIKLKKRKKREEKLKDNLIVGKILNNLILRNNNGKKIIKK